MLSPSLPGLSRQGLRGDEVPSTGGVDNSTQRVDW